MRPLLYEIQRSPRRLRARRHDARRRTEDTGYESALPVAIDPNSGTECAFVCGMNGIGPALAILTPRNRPFTRLSRAEYAFVCGVNAISPAQTILLREIDLIVEQDCTFGNDCFAGRDAFEDHHPLFAHSACDHVPAYETTGGVFHVGVLA